MEGHIRRYCSNNDVLPFTVMVAMECLRVGSYTIFKAASIDNNLSNYVLVTYSYSIAALFLLPSHFLYRRTALPPLSLQILSKFFLMSLVGYGILFINNFPFLQSSRFTFYHNSSLSFCIILVGYFHNLDRLFDSSHPI